MGATKNEMMIMMMMMRTMTKLMMTIPKLALAATVTSNSAHPVVSHKATLPLPVLCMHDYNNNKLEFFLEIA